LQRLKALISKKISLGIISDFSIYLSLAFFCGIIASLAIFPFFLQGEQFKANWGNILGSFLALISAFTLMAAQRYIQQKEKKEEQRKKEIRFFNRYRVTLIEKFEDAKYILKPYTEENKILVSPIKFELSALQDIKREAFELLGGQAGRMAEQVHLGFFEINEAFSLFHERVTTSGQGVGVEVSVREQRKFAQRKYIESAEYIVSFEKNFELFVSEFSEKYGLKPDPRSNLPILE